MNALPAALLRAVRDAAIVTAGCTVLALSVNAARPAGLPLVATQPYAILVPCPDTKGEVGTLQPDDPRLKAPTTVLVDARPAADYAAWHFESARSIPYDFLDAVPAKSVTALLGARATLVAVYGDGADPDCGKELAKELATKGLRNVSYIEGGAPALRKP